MTGVYEWFEPPAPSRISAPSPNYRIILGRGSKKFQQHLLLSRKKMALGRHYNNRDAWPFEVLDASDGEFSAIEVSGGQFQLVNRLVI